MRFADRECVPFDAGKLGCEPEELLNTNRKICAIKERAAAAVRDGLQLRKLGVPASGSDDDVRAKSKYGANVFDGCGWGCEIDDNVDAREVRPVECGCV